MLRFSATCVIVFGLAVAGSVPVRAQQPGRVSLRGTVVDELTRAPVTAALVQIITESRALAGVATDANGKFLLEASVPNEFRLRVTRLGYVARDSAITLSGNGASNVFELRIAPSPVMLDSILVVGRAESRAIGVTEQLLHGRLLDEATREPIVSGTIKLLRANGSVAATTISNQYGLFRLRSPLPGSYTIEAERIGYLTGKSLPLNLMLSDTVRLDFFLSPSAVMLNPITVTASARPWGNRYALVGMEPFFSRMSRFKQGAYYLQRDSLLLGAHRGMTTASLIRELVLQRPRGCDDRSRTNFDEPRVPFWLNGSPMLVEGRNEREQLEEINNRFPPMSLEAVEVYLSPRIPGELRSHPESGRFPCKVISLWSSQH